MSIFFIKHEILWNWNIYNIMINYCLNLNSLMNLLLLSLKYSWKYMCTYIVSIYTIISILHQFFYIRYYLLYPINTSLTITVSSLTLLYYTVLKSEATIIFALTDKESFSYRRLIIHKIVYDNWPFVPVSFLWLGNFLIKSSATESAVYQRDYNSKTIDSVAKGARVELRIPINLGSRLSRL